MLSEFIPNFLATLSHPPWTKELRWGLHLTIAGEEQVPFHAYVRCRPTPTGISRYVSSFPQFSTLPAELQNHVISFCSAKTLFQIMQVSSNLRIEASKLFWSSPTAYFLLRADWLIDGAYPAYAYCDLSFLPYVQNVLVDYDEGMEETICSMGNGTMIVRRDRIAAFWNSVMKRCPSVKRVVVDQNWISCGQESQQVPQAVRILLHSVPPDIQTAAFIVEETINVFAVGSASISTAPTYQRSLYELSAGSVWAPVKLPRPWKTILPPEKQFNGPVGKFAQIYHQSNLIQLQKDGLWPLMVESIDRHHFHMGNHIPFSCPASTCDTFFQKAGEWTVHAAKSHYCDRVVEDNFSILPKELRVEFEERELALERKGDKLRQIIDDLQDNWREQGKMRQRETERAWMEQLAEDAAWDTGTMPEKSRLWKRFLQEMQRRNYS
jgi:hypothetical protein